jgi:sugar phosphate isomerase/epimerase
MYKLGLVSVSFRNHTPEEILSAMKNCGLSCIEWGSDVHCPPEKAEEIAAMQGKYGITCCAYGTYFRLGVTPMEELQGYIDAAKTLGTNILRLWCSNKNSEDHTEEEKKQLFFLCKAAATIAEQNAVILCMECHNNTYTNKKEAALELMEAVGSQAFRMYWQPNQYGTVEGNLAYAEAVGGYTEVIHVFNWEGKQKFPLREAVELWKQYLEKFDDEKFLLLEFMPDGRLESLGAEADALREIVR